MGNKLKCTSQIRRTQICSKNVEIEAYGKLTEELLLFIKPTNEKANCLKDIFSNTIFLNKTEYTVKRSVCVGE